MEKYICNKCGTTTTIEKITLTITNLLECDCGGWIRKVDA